MGAAVGRKGGNGWGGSGPLEVPNTGKLPSSEGSINRISIRGNAGPARLSHLSEIPPTNGWRSLGWKPRQMPKLMVSSSSRLPGELKLRRGTLYLQCIRETRG